MKRHLLKIFILLVNACTMYPYNIFSQSVSQLDSITRFDVIAAENLIGLHFSDSKRDSMLDGLKEQLDNYSNIRTISINNGIPPSLQFNPVPLGMKIEKGVNTFIASDPGEVKGPKNIDDLAFSSIGQLAKLIRLKKITSEQLTRMYLNRLKKYGPRLECVITLTEELAIKRAQKADKELSAGIDRGLLHGIPYGVKDLLSTKGVRTTWGSVPYRDQIIDEDATVIKRLDEAGAVLVAKLALGELAWGDVWFGGKARNPWNYEQGSSGSSAGSAAATSAGLVTFAIGSETWGSIVSPASRCGVTGLRPSYGRVSRKGAMALSWSMDKIGPLCRTVEDCAIVFNAIVGPDEEDPTVYDVPFHYNPSINLRTLRIGYLKSDFDSVKDNKDIYEKTFAVFDSLGVNLIPIELPKYPINDLSIILSAEAGAAFDELTRSSKDDMLVRQIKDAWPNVFRLSRFIPAVEYIQSNRIRYLIIQDMASLMSKVDLYLAPSFQGNNLLLTNLTGHPCVVLPNGVTKKGALTSITFIGKLFGEGELLAVSKRYQDATNHHLKHPQLIP